MSERNSSVETANKLPKADLRVELATVGLGREARLLAATAEGERWLAHLASSAEVAALSSQS